MTTKKQLIEKIKKEVKFYAVPRAMNTRSKNELLNLYNEAKKLKLLKLDIKKLLIKEEVLKNV